MLCAGYFRLHFVCACHARARRQGGGSLRLHRGLARVAPLRPRHAQLDQDDTCPHRFEGARRLFGQSRTLFGPGSRGQGASAGHPLHCQPDVRAPKGLRAFHHPLLLRGARCAGRRSPDAPVRLPVVLEDRHQHVPKSPGEHCGGVARPVPPLAEQLLLRHLRPPGHHHGMFGPSAGDTAPDRECIGFVGSVEYALHTSPHRRTSCRIHGSAVS
mmetsp:Transcript_65097/g.141898  ORF Transcript_65097/g.141898 Transcript_65097/m.141898 type:complete len:214 (-) Transcript_65097:939-1580(-)